MAMKTQALGWMAAGVLALGVNGVYQGGGARWVHRALERATLETTGVLALATGRADRFLTEARLLTERDETASCRLGTALARMQTNVARSATQVFRMETLSARQEARVARFETDRARIEAQVAAKVARLHVMTVSLNKVDFVGLEKRSHVFTRCSRATE
jgi:methylthioribose-1-phosphate isomerase